MGDDPFTLTFTASVWVYQGKGAWFFISLPKEESERIKFFSGHPRRGWGSVRVTATIGQTTWKTSVFPDSKSGCYLLPLKAEVRKRESVAEGDEVQVTISIRE